MRNYRRRRSQYIRSSSMIVDENEDTEGIGQQRCGSRFVDTISKLNCGSSPRGPALTSLSEVEAERQEEYGNIGYLQSLSIDPTTIFPTPKVCSNELERKGSAPFVAMKTPAYRREDDASAVALEAPKRFVPLSKFQNNLAASPEIVNVVNGIYDDLDHNHCPPCTSRSPIGQPDEYMSHTQVFHSDIPECVVIPSINSEIQNVFVNNDNITEGFKIHPCMDYDFDDVNDDGDGEVQKSQCFYIDEKYELNDHDPPLQAYSSYLDDVSITNKIEQIGENKTIDFTDKNNYLFHATDESNTEYHNQIFINPYTTHPFTSTAPNREYTFNYNQDKHNKLNDQAVATGQEQNNVNDSSDDPPYRSRNANQNAFFFDNDVINNATRTYYLAVTEPTERSTKKSSLSRILHPDYRSRKISLNTSDTSFATTVSGATIATSHSTSTSGLSRSSASRKTRELIRRFERHGLQIAGLNDSCVYDFKTSNK